ncbi:UDP-3-O-acylglucosamine N-acyltransferase, partial [Frankliniella fusca]
DAKSVESIFLEENISSSHMFSGHPGSDAVTPLKKSFEAAELTMSPKADLNEAGSSNLVTPVVPSDDLTVNSKAEDDSTIFVDLQNAGIDVAEQLIIMSLSPLKIQETIPGEVDTPLSPQQGMEDNEPIDKSLSPPQRIDDIEPVDNPVSPHQEMEDNDPDDPDYVDDATAPHNLSGLDSDAGSAGESPKPRRKNEKHWKRNVSKEKNSTGKQRVNTAGKEKPARDVIPAGCSRTCFRKCHDSVTLEQRQQINEKFWSIGNSSRQWDFLSRHVRIIPIKRRTVHADDSFRKRNYAYFFTVDNQQVQVCQQMFLTTFNISISRVHVAMKKMTSKDGIISPDKRGKIGHKKRIHPSTTASVKTHIESLPGMPHTATQRQYEDIFRSEYKHKLGFFKPKKDQCGTCLRWKTLSTEEKTEAAKVQYEKHINNKKQARKIKDDNIKLGTVDKTFCVASFDLQKVFFCPYGENGEYIFRRKLRCYNLSVFQSVAKIGYCFVWDETAAKKGSIEISSCVWAFIEMKVAEGYTKFYFVSDNCWNQNKNGILFSMYNMASIKFNIEIHHSYLEKGHTQMECDSIHSLIERRCKNLTLCSPSLMGLWSSFGYPDRILNCGCGYPYPDLFQIGCVTDDTTIRPIHPASDIIHRYESVGHPNHPSDHCIWTMSTPSNVHPQRIHIASFTSATVPENSS